MDNYRTDEDHGVHVEIPVEDWRRSFSDATPYLLPAEPEVAPRPVPRLVWVNPKAAP